MTNHSCGCRDNRMAVASPAHSWHAPFGYVASDGKTALINVPFKLLLVDPKGLTLQTVDAASGVAVLNGVARL